MERLKKTVIQLSPWLILGLASFLLFYKYLLQVFPSVITDELMQVFSLSGAGLGNLAACFFYSYLVVQLFSGYLVDRFNLKYIIASSVLVSAIGTLLFAQSSSYTSAIVGRVLMGAGAAFATVGYMKVAAVYFPPKRFALVSGLLTIGVMLGAVFGEAPLAHLIHATNWQTALYYVATIGGVISLLFLLFVRDAPTTLEGSTLNTPSITVRDIKNMLTKPANWYLTLYSGLAFAPLAVFGGLWGTPYLIKTYHLTNPDAAFVVSMVYIGFGLGGPLFGLLAERFNNPFLFMRLGLVLSLFAVVTIIYLNPSLTALVPLTLIFGLGTGAFMLGFSVGKDINPLYMAATVIALINSGDAICGAFSEPLIGKLLDIFNPGTITIPTHFSVDAYHLAFLILPAELFTAYFFLQLAQRKLARDGTRKTLKENYDHSTLDTSS